MPPRIRFDVPTLIERLNAPLTLILRSHLYVEMILLKRIEETFVNKNVLDTSRVPFSVKTKLALALGKIDADDAKAFAILNRLRNNFAHDLDTEVNDHDEQMLYNTLSPKRRGIADQLCAGRQLPLLGRLRCDLVALIIEPE
jgi:hypothetical protein